MTRSSDANIGGTLPDPASEGEWSWTAEDIEAVVEELGRRAMTGRFNAQTWEGDAIEIELSSGKHTILPKYFGVVFKQWQDRP